MATIKQRGRTWQLNWSDATGQHRVSLGRISETQAEIKRREKELELLTGRRYGVSGVGFSAFCADYLIWYASQWPSTYSRTESIIRLQLLPTFGRFDLDAISPQDVTRWITKRRLAVKSATVTKEARTLHAILRRAVDWQAISRHPLIGLSPPPERASRPVEFYTANQLKDLYEASPNHEAIWQFMVNTGLRRNEALYLKLDDVRPDKVIIRSLEDRPTKGRRWREVPLNANAKAAVARLKKEGASYLLPRIAPRSLSRAFETCARRAGLPGTLHTLRHTFISHLVMAGVDLNAVKKIAGHAAISTTLRYAHLGPGHALEAVGKIGL